MRQRISETLDFFYPRYCEACRRPVDRPGRHFCSDCLNRLPFTPTDGCCRRCGRAAEKLDGEFLCEDCRTYRPSFDRAASALSFEGDAREAMNAFKFRNHLWLRDDLVDWMEAVARARFKVGEIDVIVAMPSTLWHRLDRGYNQCAYLARALAKRLKKPYAPFVLRRKGNPKKQGRLPEEEGRRCRQCSGSGYRGRIAVFEIMMFSQRVQRVIAESGSRADLDAALEADGFRTLRDDCLRVVYEGTSTLSELIRTVNTVG